MLDILINFPISIIRTSVMLLCFISRMPTLVTSDHQTYVSCSSEQITLGLPEPHEFSSLPCLNLVQSGIKRSYKESGKSPKIRLLITPPFLQKLKLHWLAKSSDHDIIMLWAATTFCFNDFFRAGEITVPSLTTLNDKCHLSWGNVSIDSPDSPQLLAIHLKTSNLARE